MKKKLSVIIAVMMISITGLLVLTGCGSSQGQNLEEYMKDQTNLRVNTDAQLSVLSPDAKGTVTYTADNKAEVLVQYYAMTDEEVAVIEPDKAESRCNAIMKPVAEQFKADTGNDMEVVVEVEGHTRDQ